MPWKSNEGAPRVGFTRGRFLPYRQDRSHRLFLVMWFTSKAPAFKNKDWGTPNLKTIQNPGHPPACGGSAD
jgi:hypothetical protein